MTAATATTTLTHVPDISVSRNNLHGDTLFANCGRLGCDVEAIEHLRIVAENAENLIIADVPYTVLHLDLCGDHVTEARRKYRLVDEFKLDECPTCHG